MGQILYRCKSIDQDDSIELQMIQIGPAAVEVQHLQEFQCPTGISRRAQQTKNHAFAHLRMKKVPRNLRWRKSVQRLLSYSIRNTLGFQWEFPQRPDRPIILPSHIHRKSQVHETWDSANRYSVWRIAESVRIWLSSGNFWKGPMGQWPYPCTSMDQDGPIELEMTQIGQAVTELQRVQEFLCWLEFLQGTIGSTTTPLHIYESRCFLRTWDDANR